MSKASEWSAHQKPLRFEIEGAGVYHGGVFAEAETGGGLAFTAPDSWGSAFDTKARKRIAIPSTSVLPLARWILATFDDAPDWSVT